MVVLSQYFYDLITEDLSDIHRKLKEIAMLFNSCIVIVMPNILLLRHTLLIYLFIYLFFYSLTLFFSNLLIRSVSHSFVYFIISSPILIIFNTLLPSHLLPAKNAESIRDRNAQQAKAQYQLPDGSFIEVL